MPLTRFLKLSAKLTASALPRARCASPRAATRCATVASWLALTCWLLRQIKNMLALTRRAAPVFRSASSSLMAAPARRAMGAYSGHDAHGHDAHGDHHGDHVHAVFEPPYYTGPTGFMPSTCAGEGG